MESYKATYMHSTNPIPGQELWETSEYNRLTAPKIKRKPGPLKTKRRKEASEEPSSSKKPKSTTNLKRQYKEFTCAYCGAKGHTKRSCKHRKTDDAAVAAATTADAATTDGAANLHETLQSEIDLTQPSYSQTDQVPHPDQPAPQTAPQVGRPDKLPPKRKVPPVDPMQGASAGTTSPLQDVYKMIPTPGFKPPRMK
ncbi:hypothetical protein PIB30_000459 [Stylosanthes scabra]|uniref:CCHC-type domain-containing protein n=1 Tax=Stylosanthes scabra TaxID=79078 RepID=A0ABU6V5L7_9FABA|nr:hypothetical protein [Stylosanthes scabra]